MKNTIINTRKAAFSNLNHKHISKPEIYTSCLITLLSNTLTHLVTLYFEEKL